VLQGARGAIHFTVFVIAVAAVWEVVKLLGGDATGAWQPPFQWKIAVAASRSLAGESSGSADASDAPSQPASSSTF